jgi:hypothetical protein
MGARWKLLTPVTVAAVICLAGPRPAAAPKFSEWSVPVPVSGVNTTFSEFGPGISKDGCSLYFGSDRPGGFGGADLWVSQRSRTTDPWGTPVNLGATINTAADELVPAFSRDGHWMFFNSSRTGTVGVLDVWASFRRNTHDDFGWTAPVNLGSNINTASLDAGATYLAGDDEGDGDGLLYFGSDRPGGMGLVDLYVSTRNADNVYGPPTLLSELNSPFSEQRPSIRHDGLEIFFYSNRPGGIGATDLWVATRETRDQVWSTPVNLGAIVNTSATEFHPSISSDGQTLYFASARPGGQGLNDLYETTRTHHPD